MFKSFDGGYHAAVVGAASGLGAAAAGYLAGLGVWIACLDIDGIGAERTAAEIREAGGRARAWKLDVNDPTAVETVFSAIDDEFSSLEALVNCAGITGATSIKAHEVDLTDFDRVHEVNLRGALVVSQAALRRMLPNGYGRILHLASIAGKDGNAGMTAYSATKAGLIGMVKSMGKDYATTGITVNALAPAVIRTPMVDALPQQTVDYMTAKIPMQRCGEICEAAEMITWIISPACSFTTGFTFDLSGGRATY